MRPCFDWRAPRESQRVCESCAWQEAWRSTALPTARFSAKEFSTRYGSNLQPETLDRDAVVRTARDQLRRCDAASGGILPYLTTANVARDFDLLRAAVGDAKFNFFGISYGGVIGETYTSLFPGRTGAMVLDSSGHYERPPNGLEHFDAQQFLIRHYTDTLGEA